MIIVIVAFIAGAVTWSFLEYALHNWVGHVSKGKNEFSREHLRHHAQKDYFAPRLKKLLTAMPVLAFAALLSSFVVGASIGIAYTLGIGLAWLGYEVLHYRLHKESPTGPMGRFLRRHHFAHHFQNPWKNHGVTSPFWDLILGTYEPVKGALQVPPSHVLDWLVDEEGAILAEYAADYQLRAYAQKPLKSESSLSVKSGV